MTRAPAIARVGESAVAHRCPADGQRIRVRLRGHRTWRAGVWQGGSACVLLAAAIRGRRTIPAAKLTAWLPE